jgi:hypothetical protein
MNAINAKNPGQCTNGTKWLLEHLICGDDGNLSWQSDPLFDIWLEVISSNLDFGDSSKDEDLRRELFFKAIKKAKRDGLRVDEWKDFEPYLQSAVSEYRGQPVQMWQILMPLGLSGPWITQKETLEVLNHKFRVARWQNLQEEIGLQGFYDDMSQTLTSGPESILEIWRFTPLLIEAYGRTQREAFEVALRHFDLLRALLTLIERYQTREHQFGFQYSPLAICPVPPVYGVFSATGSFELAYYPRGLIQNEVTEVATDVGARVESVLARIHALDDSLKVVLVDALLRFGEAMDVNDWEIAFLKLWQSLERLVHTDRQTGSDEIARRVTLLTGVQSPQSDLVKVLADKRNALVHRGQFSDEGLRQVNFIKGLVEQMVSHFLVISQKLPTAQMQVEYYKMAFAPPHELEARSKAITFILDSRKAGKQVNYK